MLVARRKSDQNIAAIDPWTAVHFAAGLGAGLMNLPFGPTIAAGALYEIVEQGIESQPDNIFNVSGPENAGNVFVDMLVLAVGWRMGQAWNRT